MLIIYFKSDGEIYRIASPYKTMREFFGKRTEEFSLIFDAIYINELNDYLFNRYPDFRVNLETKQLELREAATFGHLVKRR